MSTPAKNIYVACLSAYNNGKLHGAWISCDNTTVDAIEAEIEAMLAESPEPDAEEYAIHGYEGFGKFKVSENADLEELVELADLIDEYGDTALALTEYEVHVDRIKTFLEDGFMGEYDSKESWAEEFLTDTDSLPDNDLVRRYFDYEAYARDCELSGDVQFIEYGYRKVFVFNGHI
jgi:antirestriction protein